MTVVRAVGGYVAARWPLLAEAVACGVLFGALSGFHGIA